MATTEVTALDGRALSVRTAGASDGPAVLIHHGTPGAGTFLPEWEADAQQRGVRLVTYARPGYAGSTPHPGRTIADAAGDAAVIMDALGVERFVTWGISGGGPHALGCAALLPERVAAVASLAGVAPFTARGLNYYDGMGEDNLVEFGLAMAGREHLEPFCAAVAEQMGTASPDAVLAALDSLVSDPDKAVLSDGLSRALAAEMPLAFSDGPAGWVDDDFAFLAPFGYELDAIQVPTLIVHGHHDRFVPVSHGEWLARAIPGARAWISDEDGHLTLMVRRVPAVHDWLLGQL